MPPTRLPGASGRPTSIHRNVMAFPSPSGVGVTSSWDRTRPRETGERAERVHKRHADATCRKLRLTCRVESATQSPTLSGQMCAPKSPSTRQVDPKVPISSLALCSAARPAAAPLCKRLVLIQERPLYTSGSQLLKKILMGVHFCPCRTLGSANAFALVERNLQSCSNAQVLQDPACTHKKIAAFLTAREERKIARGEDH